MKTLSTAEQKEASSLLKRIKLTVEYGKFADEKDVVGYINYELDSEGRKLMCEHLDALDEMFNYAFNPHK